MLVALGGVLDADSHLRSIPEMPADLALAVPNDKDKIPDPRIPCCEDEVLHHRPVGKREHHFGALRCQGAHPLALAGREHDTIHSY
jgi:hypothetical protein